MSNGNRGKYLAIVLSTLLFFAGCQFPTSMAPCGQGYPGGYPGYSAYPGATGYPQTYPGYPQYQQVPGQAYPQTYPPTNYPPTNYPPTTYAPNSQIPAQYTPPTLNGGPAWQPAAGSGAPPVGSQSR